jgi:NAD(P)-dependent dehydrogenase (short-subunit alcohol dehydrogenase family)
VTAFATEGSDAPTAKGLVGEGGAYGLSKACADSYTMLLSRENPNLIINACTPGFIETDLTRRYAEAQRRSPAEMGMKSPVEGALSAFFLLFGTPEGSGHYYGGDAKRSAVPLTGIRQQGHHPTPATE